MIGQTKSGAVVEKLLYMLYFGHRLKTEEGLRYIIYEFNQSKAIAIYEKNLTDVITPKSCWNGNYPWSLDVWVKKHNQNLSLIVQNDVKISLKIVYLRQVK
jgi:hypothetical protein